MSALANNCARLTLSSGRVKIVLLTTDTTHHTYYAWKLSEHFTLQAIWVETRCWTPRFETFHPFEALRDAYERDTLLANIKSTLADLADTRVFESANSHESIAALQALSPDVMVVFGTGKLITQVIGVPSVACLNLHGGNPEQYRGLDTHLWAIYHQDFDNLVTTLHHIDAELDTGEIIYQAQLRLKRDSKLHELRAINTEACISLSLLALSGLQSTGSLPSRKQLTRGRYYSSMPSVLKEDCLRKFERHVAKL